MPWQNKVINLGNISAIKSSSISPAIFVDVPCTQGCGPKQPWMATAWACAPVSLIIFPKVCKRQMVLWMAHPPLMCGMLLVLNQLCKAMEGNCRQIKDIADWFWRLSIARGTSRTLTVMCKPSTRCCIFTDPWESTCILNRIQEQWWTRFDCVDMKHYEMRTPNNHRGKLSLLLHYFDSSVLAYNRD